MLISRIRNYVVILQNWIPTFAAPKIGFLPEAKGNLCWKILTVTAAHVAFNQFQRDGYSDLIGVAIIS